VINKADREGVFTTEKELQALLSLAEREDGWVPPIVKTIAIENKGIVDLAQAIEAFRNSQLKRSVSSERRRVIARWRIIELLREQLVARVLESQQAAEKLERLAEEVATRRRDPYSAVEEIMRDGQ
jgi:LAO/AO transport system kinase